MLLLGVALIQEGFEIRVRFGWNDRQITFSPTVPPSNNFLSPFIICIIDLFARTDNSTHYLFTCVVLFIVRNS